MDPAHAIWILLVGAAMALTGAIDGLARRTRVPSVVAYLALGMLLRLVDARWDLLGEGGRHAFAFLADIGIVVLLFRVGLESNLAGLLAKLRPAAVVWIGNVALSGLLGYLAARFGARLDVASSLVVGAALTATSIGVATSAWQAAASLGSPNGRLMLDVAELDDISGVVLLAMLLALLPVLHGDQGNPLSLLAATGAVFAMKFLAFAGLCFLFARYAEAPLTHLASRLEPAPHRMLTVAGLGFMIAALAGWLGFSLAIGALFAGLLFSRDPEAVRTDVRFSDLYTFFAPFFFIGIGLEVDLTMLEGPLASGGVLLAAAVAGKVLGATLPALLVTETTGAVLIGVSMIPRAEIALVIAHQGRDLDAISESTYTALVLVSAATCLIAPWLLGDLLRRWPQARRHKHR